MDLFEITADLSQSLDSLALPPNVPYVYNPLAYAAETYKLYLERYARSPEVVLVGMNPGPWGMAQTGVPFGDVGYVRDWLGIIGTVGKPVVEHPKRPVQGFACIRKEGSGRRLWGWAKDRFSTPEVFFGRFFVVNYCPLVYYLADGTNLTPDKLPISARRELFAVCDAALRQTMQTLKPRFVLGVGRFAEQRVSESMQGLAIHIGGVPHPSPASPQANRGWTEQVESQLQRLGIALP